MLTICSLSWIQGGMFEAPIHPGSGGKGVDGGGDDGGWDGGESGRVRGAWTEAGAGAEGSPRDLTEAHESGSMSGSGKVRGLLRGKSIEGVFAASECMPTADDAKKCVLAHQESLAGQNETQKSIFWSSMLFEDETVQLCYEKYRIDSSLALFGPNFMVLLMILLTFVGSLVGAFLKYDGLWVAKLVQFSRVFVLIVLLNTSCRVNKLKKCIDIGDKCLRQSVQSITTVTSGCLIAMSLVNGCLHVWRSSLKECSLDGDNEFYIYDCNEGYTTGSSAFISAIILMGGNTYLVTIFRCHRFWAVQVTYVITVVSCLLAAYVSPRFEQSTVIICQSLLLIIIYWNMELSNYTIFKTLLDAEAHRRQQTDELKRFIGNVSIIIVSNYTRRR